jgi:predicted site-specific integrase-resolvase
MSYRKKGLKRLLEMILERRVKRVVLTHKDRLLRFGAELVFALCEACNVEVVLMNHWDEASFEEEPVQDVPKIITVFTARPLRCTALAKTGTKSWWKRQDC